MQIIIDKMPQRDFDGRVEFFCLGAKFDFF